MRPKDREDQYREDRCVWNKRLWANYTAPDYHVYYCAHPNARDYRNCDDYCRDIEWDSCHLNLDQTFDERVESPTTDLWGSAGPDCRTMPLLIGASVAQQ
jgi:hypothetical protein